MQDRRAGVRRPGRASKGERQGSQREERIRVLESGGDAEERARAEAPASAAARRVEQQSKPPSMSGTSSGSRKDPPIVIQNTEVAAPRAAAREP